MVVENSFGRLKGRWRCLLKRLDLKLQNVPYVVSACVVLHNICEMYGDDCLMEWVDNPVTFPESLPPTITPNEADDANSIRNAIMQYFTSTQ